MSLNPFTSLPAYSLPAAAGPLAIAAIEALRTAVTLRTQEGVVIEERNVWQPDSWLIQRCWETLADSGYGREAMSVANLASDRNPLAPVQSIERLSKGIVSQPTLIGGIETYLHNLAAEMDTNPMRVDTLRGFVRGIDAKKTIAQRAEGLIAAAVAAIRIGNVQLSLAFLERLDQLPKGWGQLIASPEQRQLLGETVAKHLPHPLLNNLLASALRRYGDSGALFLHEVAQQAASKGQTKIGTTPSKSGLRLPQKASSELDSQATILDRAIDAFRYGMLATPQSQRLAIIAYGRAGLVSELLQQSNTLSNILEARRQSALDRQADQHLVRQVKRPVANSDADFQVSALTEALHGMDIHQLDREQRVALSGRLAAISRHSDGWTAASAAQTLVELGALKFASEAIDRIAPRDPTRVEAVISLVRVLLDVGEFEMASTQVEKALEWTEKSVQGRLRKQALIRGLGEVYLAKNQPETTWRLLDRATPTATLIGRVRSLFGERWNDDTLRNEALRLRALLHPAGMQLSSDPQAVTNLLAKLHLWGEQLLEGEALITFYLDSLLKPLLEAGLVSHALKFLPDIVQALSASLGEKHASRVRTLCTLLAEQALPMLQGNPSNKAEAKLPEFLQLLWQNDAHATIWQTIHSIEGAFPLMIALEGPESVLAIAQSAPAILRQPDEGVIDGGSEG